MADTKKILEHLAELYATPTATKTADEVIVLNLEKLNLNFEKYDDAFKPYTTADVMKSIDEYWKFKNDKVRPTLAHILAGLNASGAEKDKEDDIQAPEFTDPNDYRTFWNIDPALSYYMRDCATKPSNQVHGLIFYRWALNDIISELVDTLPKADKMSLSEKIAIVRRNGWDEGISDRVDKICREALNRPSAGEVEGFKQAGSLLSGWM